jgi:hypothetical protein
MVEIWLAENKLVYKTVQNSNLSVFSFSSPFFSHHDTEIEQRQEQCTSGAAVALLGARVRTHPTQLRQDLPL